MKKSSSTRAPVARREPGSREPARVLVLRAPGVNCDHETAHAFRRCGAEVAVLHVNRLLEDRSPLDGANILCLPGGFSYGDDLGAGKILGTKVGLKLRGSVLRLVDRGGLVLGICNGFQALVRAGILPGTRGVFARGEREAELRVGGAEPPIERGAERPGVIEATLARNLSGKFESRWTRVEATSDRTPFLVRGEVADLPVAHGEGRFVPADAGVLERMKANGQIALVYRRPPEGEHPGVAGSGVVPGAAGFPWNPAGSLEDMAGITDPTGQILGLMPHPERHQDPWQRPGYARERHLARPVARGASLPTEFQTTGRGRDIGSPGDGVDRPTPSPEAAGLALFRRAVEHVQSGTRLKGAFA